MYIFEHVYEYSWCLILAQLQNCSVNNQTIRSSAVVVFDPLRNSVSSSTNNAYMADVMHNNRHRVVLVEGASRKSSETAPMLTGRTDGNKRVVFAADVQVIATNFRMSSYIHYEYLDVRTVYGCQY
jgi:hypothetical protein